MNGRERAIEAALGLKVFAESQHLSESDERHGADLDVFFGTTLGAVRNLLLAEGFHRNWGFGFVVNHSLADVGGPKHKRVPRRRPHESRFEFVVTHVFGTMAGGDSEVFRFVGRKAKQVNEGRVLKEKVGVKLQSERPSVGQNRGLDLVLVGFAQEKGELFGGARGGFQRP